MSKIQLKWNIITDTIPGFCGTTNDFCADPGSCAPGFGRCDSDTTPAGPSTADAPRPKKGPVTYDSDIYDCVQNNVVALTYDDGPAEFTGQLLDTLKAYGFTATFFITGNNNGKGAIDTTAPYPDLIKRMIAEGHQVASHTWSHYSLSASSSEVRKSQMVKNEMALNNIIGKWPTYMRPPYSQCSVESGCTKDMADLGYHIVCKCINHLISTFKNALEKDTTDTVQTLILIHKITSTHCPRKSKNQKTLSRQNSPTRPLQITFLSNTTSSANPSQT